MTEKIKSYHVYTLVDCPACKRAIKLLQEKKETFAVTVLDNDQEQLNKLKDEHCWKTVPMIIGKTEEDHKYQFMLGEFIKVYPESELVDYAQSLLTASEDFQQKRYNSAK